MDDIERERPNMYVIDHKLHGTKDGIALATEILAKYPISPILFVTANEYLESELSNHRIFDGKKLKVLLKPARLQQIENDMLDLLERSPILRSNLGDMCITFVTFLSSISGKAGKDMSSAFRRNVIPY